MARQLKLVSPNPNRFALVDDEDFDRCNRHIWRIDTSDLEKQKVFSWSGTVRVPLANFILDSPSGETVYFASNNRFDFRRKNLKCPRLNPGERLVWSTKRRRRSGTKLRVPEWWKLVQEIDWAAKNAKVEKTSQGLPKSIFQPVPGPVYWFEPKSKALQIAPRQDGYNAARRHLERKRNEHLIVGAEQEGMGD